MKKTLLFVVCLCAILLISCNNSDDNANEPIAIDDWVEVRDNSLTDDLLVVTVTEAGEVFNIGNNSGNIQSVGHMVEDCDNSFIHKQTLIGTADKIYAIEHLFNSSQENNLLVYDIATNTSQRIPLTLPESVVGSQKSIVALAWDDASNLIGLLDSEFYPAGSTKHLVNISLQDYSVTEIGISFTEDIVTSMEKVGSKVYLSTWQEGLLVADITTNTLNILSEIKGTRLAKMNESELAFMQVSGAPSGARPAIINVTSQTVTPIIERSSIRIRSFFGSTEFASQNYWNLVVTDGIYFGLLQTDFSTDQSTLTPINLEDFNLDMVIVTTKPVN